MSDVKTASISAFAAIVSAALGAGGVVGAAYLGLFKPTEKQVFNSEEYKEMIREIETKKGELSRTSYELQSIKTKNHKLQVEIQALVAKVESLSKSKSPAESAAISPPTAVNSPMRNQSDISRTEINLKALQAVQASDGLTATLLDINRQGAVLTINGNKRSHLKQGTRIDVTTPGASKTCFVEIMSFSEAETQPMTMRLDYVCNPKRGY